MLDHPRVGLNVAWWISFSLDWFYSCELLMLLLIERRVAGGTMAEVIVWQ